MERIENMNKVPVMLSCKDLDYISDMINWNVIACKKAYHYSQEVQNEQIKGMLQTVSARHRVHTEKLIQILN